MFALVRTIHSIVSLSYKDTRIGLCVYECNSYNKKMKSKTITNWKLCEYSEKRITIV